MVLPYMDKQTFIALAAARINRAKELLEESQMLLAEDKYKSVNNRAYYLIEKSMQTLLALKEVNAESHNGCLKQFNVHFIKTEVGGFEIGDYKKIANAQRIRNNSDYDDFYIADKAECEQQVKVAEELYNKSLEYFKKVQMEN